MDLLPSPPSENTLYAILGAIGGFLGGLLSKLLLLVIPGYSQLLDQAKLDRETITELRTENDRLRDERDGLADTVRDDDGEPVVPRVPLP